MAWRFDVSTDQLISAGWGGSVSTMCIWWKINTDRNDSSDPWGIYPSAGGGGAIRALLGTDTDGTTMRLWDSTFAFQAAGAPGTAVWYFTGCVMDTANWTVYHGTDPRALAVVGPNTRVSFTSPGSVLISLAVEPFFGDMAAIKMFTKALDATQMALEASHYAAAIENAADLRRGFTCTNASLVPNINGTADFTALTPGATSVDIAFGPPQLDEPPPKMIKRSLPNRILRIRRGRFFTPVRLPENNSPQALPPQYFRTARTHQRLRRIDRNGFFRYPVLETEPPPLPTPPPDNSGGSYSPSWRRRIYRKRRRAVVTEL